MKVSRLLGSCLLILAGSLSLSAQTDPNLENGFKPYGTYSGSNIDTVNLENGNLMLHVPMPFGLPQRGKIQPSYFLGISSKQWITFCAPTSCYWYPSSIRDDTPPIPALKGLAFDNSLDLVVIREYNSIVDNVDPGMDFYSESVSSLVTADGATHKLFAVALDPTNTYLSSYLPNDVSGFSVVESNPDANGILQTVVAKDKAGNIYSTGPYHNLLCHISTKPDDSDPNNPGTITTSDCTQAASVTSVTDTNGNQIVLNGQDTMGRSITMQGISGTTSTNDYTGCVSTQSQPISSATISNYTGFNGATNQVKVCYSNITLSTDFNVSAGLTIYEFNSPQGVQQGPVPVIVSIVFLVDNSTWSFQYDSYGNITYLGLPLGGNIQYQWQTVSLPAAPIAQTPASRAVQKRTVTDNNGNTYITNYQYGSGTYPASFTNVMTDPLGNDTANTFSPLTTDQTASQGPNDLTAYYVTTSKKYQGSQGSGKLLKEEDTEYYSNGQTGAKAVVNAFVTQVTTTMNGQQSVVVRTPDPGAYGSTLPNFGLATAEKQYDFGGALLKETDTTYSWQSGANAANYLSANLIALPLTVQVKNASGGICAETDNGYDDPNYLTTFTGTIPNHVAPPNAVRGNLTSSSRRLTTTACSITSSTASVTSNTN